MPYKRFPEYVIVGQSGRALAESAQRSGHRVHVLDCCGDVDTTAASVSHVGVGNLSSGLAHGEVIAAIQALKASRPVAGVVPASGFEDRPELLAAIQELLPVFGNEARTVALAKNPQTFSSTLEALDIPAPEILTTPDYPGDGWLSKRCGAAGGAHVHFRLDRHEDPDCYWQRYLPGSTYSVVFLAAAGRVVYTGFSECWNTPDGNRAPFRYGGSVAIDSRDICCAAEVTAAVAKLAARLNLQGLCGIDFQVVDERRWALLEINPRPTATAEIHASRVGGFAEHLAACRGQIPSLNLDPNASPWQAHAVAYATDDVTIQPGHFPDWTSDIPTAGSHIRAGMPICTVHACSRNKATARALVTERLSTLITHAPIRSGPEDIKSFRSPERSKRR